MDKHMLWIHGWGTSSQVWEDPSAELPDYHHHFVSFSACEEAAEFMSMISHQLDEFQGEWTIVGWSMGAMLAMEIALNENRRKKLGIEAVILVSATLHFVNQDQTAGWPARIVKRMQNRLLKHPEQTLNQFKELMLSEKELTWTNKELFHKLTYTDYTTVGLYAGLSYLMESDLRPLWQELTAQQSQPRILWIHGDEDRVCPVGCLPELASNQLKVISGSGHIPFWTSKGQFYDHIRGFLNECE